MSEAPEPGRPQPFSVSGVFPSLDRLTALLPLLEGVDRRVLVDVPRAMLVAEKARAASADPENDTSRGESPAEQLAAHIRHGTRGLLEPRDVVGYWDVLARYGLVQEGTDHRLRLSRRGREAVHDPEGRVVTHLAGREGLLFLLGAVEAGHTQLASLLPAWRHVLEGNPRFAAKASHPRSLGQRVAALVRGGWLSAHDAHAERLADETGFRRREAEPAFADLGGGLALTDTGRACLRAQSGPREFKRSR